MQSMTWSERMREKADALRQRGHALILAVESSCDETAMALVEDGRTVLAGVIASQIDVHALYGGVVPEIASRMHVEALDPLYRQVMSEAAISPERIDAVAVTNGPGLVGALLTGVSWAKGYAYARDLPLIGVDHLEGHVSANYVAHPDLEPPFVALVASGGHSHIIRVSAYGVHEVLGITTDDAAGEAFDKVARVLEIPYPGGPLLDRMAEEGDPHAYRFPRPATEGRYDFSFSGLKTAVINRVHQIRQAGGEIDRADLAASFRFTAVEMLTDKAVLAACETGAKVLTAAGGVSANSLLRQELVRKGEAAGLKVFLPPKSMCTDNAVMIGSAGFYTLMRGGSDDLTLNAVPTKRLRR